MARAAEELGRKLREEDSFGKAMEFIERKWTRTEPDEEGNCKSTE